MPRRCAATLALIVVLEAAAAALVPDALARTSARACREACIPRLERNCTQRAKSTRQRCRAAIVRDCRRHGTGECNLSGRSSFGGEFVVDYSCDFDDPDPDPRLRLDFTHAAGAATFTGVIDDGVHQYPGEGTLLANDGWSFHGRSCAGDCCFDGVLEGTSYDSNTAATWATTITCDQPFSADGTSSCTVRIGGRFYRFCILGACID